MTDGSPFSPQFHRYVELGQDGLEAVDDAWVVADNYGETRHYIREKDGMLTITETHRGGIERFVMAAEDRLDAERYMTDLCGRRIRALRSLPRIKHPTDTESIHREFHVEESREGVLSLLSSDGRSHGVFPAPLDYADDVIWFSWIAGATTEKLRESYLSPDGLPLFPECRIDTREQRDQ
jgi:hypothetical protein